MNNIDMTLAPEVSALLQALTEKTAAFNPEQADKDGLFSFGAHLLAIGKQMMAMSGNAPLSENKTGVISIDDPALHRCVMAALRELDRAVVKFPIWPTDNVKRAAVVAEEAGELIQAANDHDLDSKLGLIPMHQEATQTAAMALRMMLALHHDIYREEVQHG